jgi:hypothetical protein
MRRFFSTTVGRTPLVRAGPPGPAASSIDKYHQQADEGVGRGPGGPPHCSPEQVFFSLQSFLPFV